MLAGAPQGCEDAPVSTETGTQLDDARRVLREVFGHEDFRPGQDEAVSRVLEGENFVIVMPTGAGKSACYQIPALVRPGLTLVLSPLIALMKDQVESLKAKGVAADFVNSSIPASEQARRLEAAARGELKLLYVAPERLSAPSFLRAMERAELSMLAVDEAHCISQWGHDFRPAYDHGLREFLARLPRLQGKQPQVIGLTATATPPVRRDVASVLGQTGDRVLVTGFKRENLRLLARRCDRKADRIDQVLEIAKGVGGSGIVYCGTRRDVEGVTETLRIEGLDAVGYHAGLPDEERARVQESFLSGSVPIIVATNAFGMGIDKPDIRFVVHNSLPGSIEAYYQEAGRAGRDGAMSYCVLVHGNSDRFLHEFFLDGSCPPEQAVLDVYDALCRMPDGVIERASSSIAADAGIKDIQANGALRMLEDAGLIERLDDRDNPAQLRLDRPAAEIAATLPNPSRRRQFIEWVGERFSPEPGAVTPIKPGLVEADLGLHRETFLRLLRELEEAELAEAKAPFRGRGILLRDSSLVSRPAVKEKLAEQLARSAARRERGEERIDRMAHYAYQKGCRHRFLLEYFGDEAEARCNACDNCCGWTREDRRASDSAPRRTRSRGPARSRALNEEQAAEARRAGLAVVAKLHQRFGMGVVKLVLRGSKSKKVTGQGLDRLDDYAALARLSAGQVDEVLAGLQADGLIETTDGPYPMVLLTEEGALEAGC
jgi:ATP-dependent DNA helicase RecQ